MKTALIIGGPLVLSLIAFSIWSGIVSFGEVDGLEHKAGAEPGGTFVLSIEPSTGITEIEEIGLEIEREPIEYREGDELTTVRKLNGLTKYTNITVRWPSGFDKEQWKFIFEDKCPECSVEVRDYKEPELGFGQEMHQIDPPTLVIPAR